MNVKIFINGLEFQEETSPDKILLDYLREKGFLSVKRGCETSNCGLCTVHMDGRPILSCSTLLVRADGHQITTLEGLQKEATEFGEFLADEGGDQCGFCNPGFIMNVLAMKQELKNPTEEEIKKYLAGNLCRCTGYMAHLRALKKYLQQDREV